MQQTSNTNLCLSQILLGMVPVTMDIMWVPKSYQAAVAVQLISEILHHQHLLVADELVYEVSNCPQCDLMYSSLAVDSP